eukprot:scaffold290019_cov37-Prasinocladus_malaysianus.AAC.1
MVRWLNDDEFHTKSIEVVRIQRLAMARILAPLIFWAFAADALFVGTTGASTVPRRLLLTLPDAGTGPATTDETAVTQPEERNTATIDWRPSTTAVDTNDAEPPSRFSILVIARLAGGTGLFCETDDCEFHRLQL